MPDLAYGTSSFERAGLPPLSLVNMIVEKAATSKDQTVLKSRQGLSVTITNGAGPINGIYANRGTFSGDVFSISGTALYRETTSEGAISGTGAASFAGSSSELLVTRGGDLHRYDGSTISTVSFPDSASVRAICFIGSLFVAVRGDGDFPGRYYWSNVLDGSTWDALNFATAEREPDDLLDIAALNDKIILYGQSTIELWSHTGDADLPFARIEGIGSQSKGILATGAKCEADNTLFHVGSDGVVYRLADDFMRISDHWLEAKITASASVSLFSFRWEGHEFVCVRLDGESFLYDCATQTWPEFQSDGQWVVQCAAMKGTTAYFGHDSTGQIMGWSGWADLGSTLTREFTAGAELDQSVSFDNLWLWAEVGDTSLLSGQGSDPKVEIEFSTDGGKTWTDFDDASLGAAGQYRTIPEWRRLGQFDAPGALFRFRVTDPVPFSVMAVKYNEPLGGRRG